MPKNMTTDQSFNIMIVGQAGRLGYEAVLFAASLRAMSPLFSGELVVVEPQPGEHWRGDPRMSADQRNTLEGLGARIAPFESVHFGQDYPYGNKIEGLKVMPAGVPFVFFDSDTLMLGEVSNINFDFSRPSASMKREGTWPVEELYWPGYGTTWKSLYDRFDLDYDSSLDLSQPDEYWQRYLYFNAGWFFGADPAEFGARFERFALEIRDNRPEELVLQPLDPWLDQVTLPLVIHSFGGGRPDAALDGLDGNITCHWRMLSLLYAREPDAVVEVLEAITAPQKIKKVLKEYEPFKRMIYQGRGQKCRALFDQNNLPRRERQLRNQIKKAGYWMR